MAEAGGGSWRRAGGRIDVDGVVVVVVVVWFYINSSLGTPLGPAVGTSAQSPGDDDCDDHRNHAWEPVLKEELM